MNKFAVKGLTLALMMAGGSAMAALPSGATGTTVSGGSVHFTGSVVDAACAVSQDSVNKEVPLDQVRLAAFGTTPGAGVAAGQKKAFSISLADCDSTVSSQAALTFNGTEPQGLPGALDNTAGAGGAQGIGIQIYDADGSALPLGQESKATTLIDGTNNLNFTADYITTSDTAPTAGTVDATATFNVTYQ